MFSVSAVHHLITISRFPSHFSFSALAERIVTTIKLRSLQKRKLKKRKRKHKAIQDTIQMLTENSLFRTSENQILQEGLPIKKFSDRNVMTESNSFVEECC